MMWQLFEQIDDDLNKFESENNAIATQVSEMEVLGDHKGPEFDYFWTNEET